MLNTYFSLPHFYFYERGLIIQHLGALFLLLSKLNLKTNSSLIIFWFERLDEDGQRVPLNPYQTSQVLDAKVYV